MLLYFHLLFLHFLDRDYGSFTDIAVRYGLEKKIPGGLLNTLVLEDNHWAFGTDFMYSERWDSASFYLIDATRLGPIIYLDGSNTYLGVGGKFGRAEKK